MHITYTGGSTELRELIEKKLARACRGFQLNQVDVHFISDKQQHSIRIKADSPSMGVTNASGDAEEMHKAIDIVIHKLARQLSTKKGKMDKHG